MKNILLLLTMIMIVGCNMDTVKDEAARVVGAKTKKFFTKLHNDSGIAAEKPECTLSVLKGEAQDLSDKYRDAFRSLITKKQAKGLANKSLIGGFVCRQVLGGLASTAIGAMLKDYPCTNTIVQNRGADTVSGICGG